MNSDVSCLGLHDDDILFCRDGRAPAELRSFRSESGPWGRAPVAGFTNDSGPCEPSTPAQRFAPRRPVVQLGSPHRQGAESGDDNLAKPLVAKLPVPQQPEILNLAP